jgi:hypothetical protein
MKKSKSSDIQIMDTLKRVEAGRPVSDLCHEVGISTAIQRLPESNAKNIALQI